MNLELITRRPKGQARGTPLLFVHGAFGGAWMWDQHFLPYFADRGWEVHALSLRGHGKSDGAELVRFARLRDYVADVEQVLDDMSEPPVLIGHSLGGMIVQKCLHRRSFPAAVLMASAPPHGTIGTLFGMAFTNPHLLRELSFALAINPDLTEAKAISRALFSEDTPEELVRRYMPHFQEESMLINLDLLGLDLPPSLPLLDLPVLVLGAEKDQFIYEGALTATAATYRTKAEIFSGMAHAMMLDHGWETVAARMAGWLQATMDAPIVDTQIGDAQMGSVSGAVQTGQLRIA
ncbi:MAG: alpha/beta fold hydrolase [Defluviicoccus sp.]|nr:MAG: alpha/beta fold hydrolase [Defluviicoccus sp.]